MESTKAQLQKLSSDYQTIESTLQSHISARQKLEAQNTENRGVRAQLDKLAPDDGIYKLVGPVLLKQERGEVVGVVQGRLEFIGKELKRVDAQIEEEQKRSEEKKREIIQLQNQAQQEQQGG